MPKIVPKLILTAHCMSPTLISESIVSPEEEVDFLLNVMISVVHNEDGISDHLRRLL